MMLLTKHPLSHSEKIAACSLSINKDGHLNNTGNPLSFISNLFHSNLKFTYLHVFPCKTSGRTLPTLKVILMHMGPEGPSNRKTLPKALRTQALTPLTSIFGLIGLVQYAS